MRGLLVALFLIAAPALADLPGRLSIDITTLEGEDYSVAVALALQAGASVTSLSLAWDEIEPAGTYAPVNDWPAIANSYYPGAGMGLTRTFSVIDTTADRRPADLKSLAWDDPVLIDRFNRHLTDVLSRMPEVELLAIAVGNEVDVLLTADTDIAAFARFVTAARATLQTLRPGVPVAAKLTAPALLTTPDRYAAIVVAGDAVFATYYPLQPDFSTRAPDAPATDLPALVAAAGGKPLYLLEAGYPSAGCNATPEGQEAFVKSLLATWRSESAHIPLISLSWLTDISPAETAAFGSYYGLTDSCFLSYLATLGLRDAAGQPKPALTYLLKAP